MGLTAGTFILFMAAFVAAAFAVAALSWRALEGGRYALTIRVLTLVLAFSVLAWLILDRWNEVGAATSLAQQRLFVALAIFGLLTALILHVERQLYGFRRRGPVSAIVLLLCGFLVGVCIGTMEWVEPGGGDFAWRLVITTYVVMALTASVTPPILKRSTARGGIGDLSLAAPPAHKSPSSGA